MRIEVLMFAGCPNYGLARELVVQAVFLESVDAVVGAIEVESPEAARIHRFLGSPSVRVDGKDVEPSANRQTAYGLMCRTYNVGNEVRATPSLEMIRAAIRDAAKRESYR